MIEDSGQVTAPNAHTRYIALTDLIDSIGTSSIVVLVVEMQGILFYLKLLIE